MTREELIASLQSKGIVVETITVELKHKEKMKELSEMLDRAYHSADNSNLKFGKANR